MIGTGGGGRTSRNLNPEVQRWLRDRVGAFGRRG